MKIDQEKAFLSLDEGEDHDEADCGCVLARDEEDKEKVAFVPCELHATLYNLEDGVNEDKFEGWDSGEED